MKTSGACLSAKVASILIKSVSIFGFYWYEPSLAPADWGKGPKQPMGCLNPFPKSHTLLQP